jgi:hypothetical protein
MVGARRIGQLADCCSTTPDPPPSPFPRLPCCGVTPACRAVLGMRARHPGLKVRPAMPHTRVPRAPQHRLCSCARSAHCSGPGHVVPHPGRRGAGAGAGRAGCTTIVRPAAVVPRCRRGPVSNPGVRAAPGAAPAWFLRPSALLPSTPAALSPRRCPPYPAAGHHFNRRQRRCFHDRLVADGGIACEPVKVCRQRCFVAPGVPGRRRRAGLGVPR